MQVCKVVLHVYNSVMKFLSPLNRLLPLFTPVVRCSLFSVEGACLPFHRSFSISVQLVVIKIYQ